MLSSIVKPLILEIGILLICLLGDHLLSSPVTKQPIVRVTVDSLTHGLVGGLSWAVVTDIRMDRQRIIECIVCLGLAMAVDVDHFIAAKSFHLKGALSLQKRPFFHATTVIIIIDGILLLFSIILRTRSLQLFAMLFSVAWLSHHIRDSTRRGLWFPPFGETPPLHRYLYLTIILLLPVVTRIIHDLWKTHAVQRTIQYHTLESV